MKRRGDWIQTYTGIKFYPLDPRPEEIGIIDIAHALSLQCRFSGHVRVHYSVAEHSVRGARHITDVTMRRAFLLHDAAEAYLVDLPRPLKHFGLFGWLYRRAEHRMEAAIADRFWLPNPMPAVIKYVDGCMLNTERRDLMATPPIPWRVEQAPAFTETIEPWTPAEAEKQFLEQYELVSNEWADSRRVSEVTA